MVYAEWEHVCILQAYTLEVCFLMERLTKKDEYGNADILGVDSGDLQLNLDFESFNKVTNALNKLAEYEDLEEQGMLLRLPCKVGDTVFPIFKYTNCGEWNNKYRVSR